MDATVASGAAAMMAIRVLLDHEVPEENINLVSLLMAESGVHTIAYAFPKVKIVTTAVDPEINDKFYVLPGIGNFANRYFGTEPHIVLPPSISNFNRQQSSSSQTSLCSKHPSAKHWNEFINAKINTILVINELVITRYFIRFII